MSLASSASDMLKLWKDIFLQYIVSSEVLFGDLPLFDAKVQVLVCFTYAGVARDKVEKSTEASNPTPTNRPVSTMATLLKIGTEDTV